MTDRPKIFVVSSPVPSLFQNIVLYQQTWAEHIVPGHPDVATHIDSVKATVANPSMIIESATEGNFKFINLDVVNELNEPLTVPVKPLGGRMAGKVGVVLTAFFSLSVFGNMIYRRPTNEGEGHD
jgi:hypothetical protein